MKRILYFTCATLLFFCSSINAQEDSSNTTPEFKISLNYNSYLHYYGRTDSLKSSGVFPMAELWLSRKFYINAAPIFTNNKIQKIDYAGTVATAGYQSHTEKWLTHLYVTKPFYKSDADLVQSALKAQTGLSVSQLNKIANLTVGGDVKFSDAMDFGVMGGLDHIVRIENKDNSILVFDPSIYAYAGTQRFSRTYIKKNTGPLPLPIGGEQEEGTESVNQFRVLAYELSMPVVFAKGKLQLIAIPSYIIPQNLITVENRPDLSERGEKSFSGTITIKLAL